MKYGYARESTRPQDLEGQIRQPEEEHCDKTRPIRSKYPRCSKYD